MDVADKIADAGVARSLRPMRSSKQRMGFKPFFNEPFGWQRGTVRGILTFWVTITTCILMFVIVFNPFTPWDFKMQILRWWLTLAFVVIGSYFLTRYVMRQSLF